jgi:hypothetical protein
MKRRLLGMRAAKLVRVSRWDPLLQTGAIDTRLGELPPSAPQWLAIHEATV